MLLKVHFSCAVLYKKKIAGVIGFNQINMMHLSAMIGYWLGNQYQGKGLMLKACKAIVDFGFNELELNRQVIRCAVQNKKSQAIPLKLGFVKEGCFRQAEKLHHGFVDHYGYAMLACDWKRITKGER